MSIYLCVYIHVCVYIVNVRTHTLAWLLVWPDELILDFIYLTPEVTRKENVADQPRSKSKQQSFWQRRLWVLKTDAKVMSTKSCISFLFFFSQYRRERSQRPILRPFALTESHRGRHRRQCNTPGCNWQLSTLVSCSHFSCQFPPHHICRPWTNTYNMRATAHILAQLQRKCREPTACSLIG